MDRQLDMESLTESRAKAIFDFLARQVDCRESEIDFYFGLRFIDGNDERFVPFVEVLEDGPCNHVFYMQSNTYRENAEKMLQARNCRIFIWKEFPGRRIYFKIPGSLEELLILTDIA